MRSGNANNAQQQPRDFSLVFRGGIEFLHSKKKKFRELSSMHIYIQQLLTYIRLKRGKFSREKVIYKQAVGLYRRARLYIRRCKHFPFTNVDESIVQYIRSEGRYSCARVVLCPVHLKFKSV